MQSSTVRRGLERAASIVGGLVERGVGGSFGAARFSIDMLRMAARTSNLVVEGAVFPAVDQTLAIQEQLSLDTARVIGGALGPVDAVRSTVDHVRAAAGYARTVDRLGRELFGSARFAGEELLVEEGAYRLSYLPAVEGVPRQPFALFHAGGLIPYGDRLFRLLPECNFYGHFLARGIPVYAMELRGDATEVNYGQITLDGLIERIEHFSSVAHEHNAGGDLVLEGYCGHGAQALAYVAAKPEDAQRKFALITTFVSPLDGTECDELAAMIKATPAHLLSAVMKVWELLGGAVPGSGVGMWLDLPLRLILNKSPLGGALTGWHRTDLLGARTVADLDPGQRRWLAGAYWVSAAGADRFPISVDVMRFGSKLFTQGIGNKGELPHVYEGRPLSLATIAQETNLEVLGFYGAKDSMVPDRTAHCLSRVFGDRYTHVVHPQAGHVSYVFSPGVWKAGSRRALVPNPIDLMIEKLASRSG